MTGDSVTLAGSETETREASGCPARSERAREMAKAKLRVVAAADVHSELVACPTRLHHGVFMPCIVSRPLFVNG